MLKRCNDCNQERDIECFRLKPKQGVLYRNSVCSACERRQKAERYKRNKLREQQKALQRYYDNGRKQSAHKKKYPEANREASRRRRARLRDCPVIERINRQKVIQRDNGTCYICGRKPEGVDLTLDHVIPLEKGGTHTEDNLRVACRSCNSIKGTKNVHDLPSKVTVR